MKKNADPLKQSPSLRYLRDSLLVRDPVAKVAGEDFLTKVILLSSISLRLPPDRLICTEDAARLIGIDVAEFDRMAYKAKIKPKYVSNQASYWVARDVYSLVD